MQLVQTHKGIVNDYTVTHGSRLVRISHDTEKTKKAVTVVTYLNHGETVGRSKSFGSLKGAMKWAEGWLKA